jgi:hypothetical protein
MERHRGVPSEGHAFRASVPPSTGEGLETAHGLYYSGLHHWLTYTRYDQRMPLTKR